MENEGISVATLLRHKAEALLKIKPEQTNNFPSEGELLKLLHELEVYCVELELQNEELLTENFDVEEIIIKNRYSDDLKQRLIHEFEINQIELNMQSEELSFSKAISQDVAERYSDLFNFSSSGYLILSNTGEIIDLNHAGARLLGKDRLGLKNSMFGFFVQEDQRSFFNDFLGDIFQNKLKLICEVTLSLPEFKNCQVQLTGILTQNGDQCLMTLQDITERNQSTKYKDITRDILQILNEPGAIKDAIQQTLELLKKRTGFDAIGIRMQEGNDYPYMDQMGFSSDFMLTENSLIELDKKGRVCRDKNGNPRLACTCGLVISGSAGPVSPNVSAGGSWWTNDSFPILDLPASEDARFRPRNLCMHKGYASIALVPIRNNDKIAGLIQFNNFRKNVFNKNKIEFLEGIASHIGSALTRKQAEETLRKNEELLRTITENAPDIIIQLDKKGTILYMNRAFPGYTVEETIGKNFCEWTFPEYHELMNQSLVSVFQEATSQTYLSRGYDLQRNTCWYRTSISPVKEGNTVKNAILITRDITQNILSEEILRVNEEKMNAIILTAMDGFWLVDRRGCFLEVNDTLCRMIGYSRQELLTMRIRDIEVTENEKDIADHIKNIQTLGEDRFESLHRCKDGSIINVEVSVQYRDIKGGQFIAFIHDITERKKAQDAIAASENEFRLLTESMPQIVWTTTADGQNTYFNHQWVEYTGLTLEESYGNGWNIPFHPDDQQRAWCAWQDAVQHNGDYLLQCRLRRFDGVYRWWLLHGVPVVDKKGTIIKWYGTCTDIDEMKNAGDAILNNEKLLRSVIENVSSGVALIDETGKFIVYNPVFLKLFGLSPSSTIKNVNDQDWSQWQVFDENKNLLDVDDHPVRKAAMTRKLVRNQLVAMKLPNGNDFIWMMISAEPLLKEDGTIDKIICTYLDITEHKRAEEQIKESEERFRTMANAIPQLSWIANADGYIYWYNQRWYDFTGTTPEQMEGWGWQQVHDPDVLPGVLERWKDSINTGETFEMEFPIRRADGIFRTFLTRIMPLKDAKGQVIQWFGTNTDVEEIKKAEQSLRQSEGRYKSLFQDNYSVMLLIHPETGMIIDANPAACRYYGWSNAELCSKNIYEINMLSQLEVANEMQLAKEENRNHFFFRHRLASNEIQDVEVYSGPIKFGDETMLYSVVHDITEQKIAEIALRESKERISTVINSIADTFYSLDDEWRFTTVNASAELAPFGRPASEMLGHVIWDLYPNLKGTIIHQHYLDAAAKQCLEQYISQSPLNGLWYEVFMQGRKGGVDVYMRDISDRKIAEEALQQSEERHKSLFQYNHSVMMLLDPETGRIIDVNPAACAYYGWTHEELCAKKISEINPVEEEITLQNLQETKSNYSAPVILIK